MPRVPDHVLTGTWLANFAVGEFNTLGACRDLIEGLDGLEADRIFYVLRALQDIKAQLPREERPAPLSVEDFAILGDIRL